MLSTFGAGDLTFPRNLYKGFLRWLLPIFEEQLVFFDGVGEEYMLEFLLLTLRGVLLEEKVVSGKILPPVVSLATLVGVADVGGAVDVMIWSKPFACR